MSIQAADGVSQGTAELRTTTIDVNEKHKGAEAQEDYAAELESLFGVEKGHLHATWEPPQNPLISDSGTSHTVPGAYNPHQPVPTACMDVVRDAHQVMWCDTAIRHPCMPATVITVGSENGPKSDILGNSSSDIQSELNKALEMGGTLPEKINEKEKERLSLEDPVADSPGAAIRAGRARCNSFTG